MGRAGAIIVGALAVAGLLLGLPASGQAAPRGDRAEAAVVKGTTAPISNFPWLVAIGYDGPVDDFGCTGTIVAPRLVLTAGHCAVAESGRVLDASNYRVILGRANLEDYSRGSTELVSQVLVFPGFDPNTLHHDAALLVLREPVGVPAIPLATAADGSLYAPGTPLTIAGWGLTDGFATTAPAAFRSGRTEIAATPLCRRKTALLSVGFEPASQLCASDRRQREVGACKGDSGGPGIAQRADGSAVQVGIISLGSPFCDLSIPEVQTRVDQVSAWVASWAAAVEAGAPPPAVAIPPPFRLPRLTFDDARLLAHYGLANDFGKRFLKGRFKGIGCGRIEREKVKCRVFWYLAGSVYDGSVTIYYALPREGSLANIRYRIRRAGARCWLQRGSVKRCPGVLFYR